MARIKSEVFWYTLKQPDRRPLTENASAEVVVVGGGMAGLSCAQELRRQGREVIVVERQFCGAGASGKSSGFITPDSELELGTLIDNFGEDGARRLWEFAVSGVNGIRTTLNENDFSCDYQPQDSLFVANSPAKFRKRVEHEDAARKRLSYQSTLYTKETLPGVLGAQRYYGGVRYPDTFGINAFLYCQSLKDVLQQQGVRIYEGRAVTGISASGVQVGDNTITAKQVVVCCDRFLPELGLARPQVYQVQTFLGISPQLEDSTVQAMFPSGKMMVWDTDLIYQYYRIVDGNRLLIGAASMFYTYLAREIRRPVNVIGKMRRYLKTKFPALDLPLEYVWPGMIGVSKDFVPLVGRDLNLPNALFISGATGLPWAAALGRYTAEKITTGRDDFDRYFTPQRKFPVGTTIQRLLMKPLSFAVSHGIIKYF
jgi:gamma-glutamylputrescine oxidase